MGGVTYITDMGVNHVMVDDSGKEAKLERYGVWKIDSRGKYGVVEVGDDLSCLMAKYGVPVERVVPIASLRDEKKV